MPETSGGRRVAGTPPLFPRDRVSYWSDDPSTAKAEARKYNPRLDLITFHAYDDASSFPASVDNSSFSY